MIYDTAILGAGPCGLAVASRFCEASPSALFTDIEHARFWNRRHDKNTIENCNSNRKDSSRSHASARPASICTGKSIIVLDATSNTWMSSWRQRFEKLNITHLRSPLFFHPDPGDRDGLLAFAYAEGREHELVEIGGVVGREVSKHSIKKESKTRLKSQSGSLQVARHLHLDNRDRNDYFTPSSNLFDAYIDCVVGRYDLSNIVQQAQIVDIRYKNDSELSKKIFSLTGATGCTYFARTVVLATGPANIPQIPPSCPLLSAHNANGSATHIFDTTKPLIPPYVKQKSKSGQSAKVLIVGGGLTSAQVVDLLLSQHGVSKVHLVLRSKLKVKHFDVDLPWVAKLRNRRMAEFWSANTDKERFEMLKAARGGGSITPGYEKILGQWEKNGKLEIHIEHEIDATSEETKWDSKTNTWSVSLKPSVSNIHSTIQPNTASTNKINQVDHIIFATSTPPSIHNVPFLTNLNQSHPITDISGLPVLTQDLMWRDDIPLFITGALAGLRLGPGAGNLGGARLGAERVAWGIEDWFARAGDLSVDAGTDTDTGTGSAGQAEQRRDSGCGIEHGTDSEVKQMGKKTDADLLSAYTTGLGNRFAGLEILDE